MEKAALPPPEALEKIGVCASGERIDRLGGWCFGTPSRAIPRAGKKGATVAERFPGLALSVRRPHPEIKLGVAERRAARFTYVYTAPAVGASARSGVCGTSSRASNV